MSEFASIKRTELVRDVARRGRRLRSGAITTSYLRGRDNVFRLCVVVPKNCGNAVKRNRMRRVIREACRREVRKNDIPCSVVVTFRGRIREDDYKRAAVKTEQFLRVMAEKC